jgi:chorismate synthase
VEELEIRRLRTNEEYLECLRLQRLTWGDDFSERVPIAILKVSQRIGGICAGAFDSAGRLVGFVFGMTGVEEGRLVHWSDMLAVAPSLRDVGIGRRLKQYQRAELLRTGVEVVYWTFDPLVARNAHINLVRLGVEAVEYVIDMYGSETDSELHRGLGTDRLVVVWRIAGSSRATPSRNAAGAVPLVRSGEGGPAVDVEPLALAAPRVTIEVPGDIEAVQRQSLELATRWRAATRQSFTSALAEGYMIVGFRRGGAGGPPLYLLERAEKR